MIDTHKIFKQLEEAEQQDRLPEAIAEALASITTSELASKTDIDLLRTDIKNAATEMRGEVIEVRADLRTSIAELRGDLHTSVADLKLAVVKADRTVRASVSCGGGRATK